MEDHSQNLAKHLSATQTQSWETLKDYRVFGPNLTYYPFTYTGNHCPRTTPLFIHRWLVNTIKGQVRNIIFLTSNIIEFNTIKYIKFFFKRRDQWINVAIGNVNEILLENTGLLIDSPK